MDEIRKTLLYIIYNLVNIHQDVTIDAIINNLELVNCIKSEVDGGIKSLIDDGYIIRKNKSIFILTEKGKVESQEINTEKSKDEFNELIDRATSSKAYLDYCSEIYGYNMYLFNMMDKPQLDHLLNAIPIDQNDTILDLGCGNGSILNSLMQKYCCQGIGIDQLNSEVIKKNNKLISYIDGDIDNFEKYGLSPSITIAVDSLYFSNHLDKLMRLLTSIKGNRLYLYYSQYIFDEKTENESILKSNNTRLAKSLEQEGINYRVIDYSENERELYEKAMGALPKYKEAFKKEGNIDLFEKKLNENRFGKELYENGCASRYLYIIDQPFALG